MKMIMKSIRRAGLAAVAAIACVLPSEALDMTGEWIGSYNCAQGLTALRLVVQQEEYGELFAQFEFGEHPQNPGVPYGVYKMHGNVDRESQVVVLEGVEWVQRPAGFHMVDMAGLASPTVFLGDITRLTGTNSRGGCSTFRLERKAGLIG